jgi:hypothetical protein
MLAGLVIALDFPPIYIGLVLCKKKQKYSVGYGWSISFLQCLLLVQRLIWELRFGIRDSLSFDMANTTNQYVTYSSESSEDADADQSNMVNIFWQY